MNPIPLKRCEIWSDLVSNSGTRSAVVPFTSCVSTEKLEGLVVVPRVTVLVASTWSGRSLVTNGKVVRLLYTDDTFDEFRIHNLRDVSGGDGLLRIEAAGPILDLAARNKMIALTTAGIVNFVVVRAATTPVNLFGDVITAAPAYFSTGAGVVTPTAAIDVTFADDTPLSGAIKVATEANRVTGTIYWVSAIRNGVSGYYLALTVPTGGGSVVLPRFWSHRNLLSLIRIQDSTEQTTRAFVTTGENQLGDNQWKVTAVVANTSIDVEDINGGLSPLLVADALNNWYAVDDAGTGHLITDSIVQSGTVARLLMSSTTNIAVGDWIRLSPNSSGDQASYLDDTTAQATYGIKIGTLPARVEGKTNWFKNADVRDFSGTIPVDWNEDAVPGGTITKETGVGLFLTGGASMKITQGAPRTPRATRSVYCTAGALVTYTVWIYITVFSVGAAAGVEFTNPNGGTDLHLLDGSDSQLATLNKWITCTRTYTVTSAGAKTLQARVITSTGTNAAVYVDAAQVTLTPSGAAIPATTFARGSGSATNWLQGLTHLRTNANPILSYSCNIVDLYRLSPTIWSGEQLGFGATVHLKDEDLGVNELVTTRIVELTIDHGLATDTKVVLSNRRLSLTNLLA